MWFVPKKHQATTVSRLLRNNECTVLAKPGTGKTTIALSLIKILMEQTLIIAPLQTVLTTWPDEIDKWAQFRALDYGIAHGKHREDAFGAMITLMNPEGLAWLIKSPSIIKNKKMLICDEGTLFKTWMTERSKRLRKLLSVFERRYVLTGTPVPSNLLDWFSQQFISDGGKSFGKTIGPFKAKYFYLGGYKQTEWVPFKESSQKLAVLAKDHCVLAENADIKLPGIHIVDIEVSLDKRTRAIYDELRKKLRVVISGEKYVARDLRDSYGMLRQIAAGSIYKKQRCKDGKKLQREWEVLHSRKANKVREILADINSPTCVIYRYDFEITALRKVLKGLRVAELNGKTPVKDRAKIKDNWNAKKYDALLVQPQCIAHGLNMQVGGNHMIHCTLTDRAELYEQINQRMNRMDAKKAVIIYRVLVSDTVETKIVVEKLRRRAKTQRLMLEHCKAAQDESI